MENASGAATLVDSLKTSARNIFLHPARFVASKPFLLIFMLYGGTYMTANTLDTAMSTTRNKPASTVTAGTAKFAASTTANVGLCIFKDQAFVRLFGPPGVVPRPVPLPTYLVFTARDCLTIFASFNVPPLLGPVLSERMSKEWQRIVSGQTVAQFAAPAMVQFVSTPLHLLGLDLYNRPSAGAGSVPPPTWRQRVDIIKKNWLVSSAMRVCRIVPAFGVGGVVNTRVRRSLMEKLE